MTKVSVIAASVVMALGLTACGKAPEQGNSTATASTATTPVADKKASEPAVVLGSGIDTQYIDASVRPQDDFFHYVNGKWLKDFEIPADKSLYGSFTRLRDTSRDDLKVIIDSAAERAAELGGGKHSHSHSHSHSHDAKAEKPLTIDERKLGDFYNSFMNEKLANELGVTPVGELLDRIQSITNMRDLTSELAYLRISGVTMPIAWYVNNDAKNSSQYATYLYQNGLTLPDRDYYLKDDEKYVKNREAFKRYISTMLSATGYKDAEAAAERVLAFETALAEHSWNRVDSRNADKTYNPKDPKQVDALLGEHFSWADYAKVSGLDKADLIVVNQPSFMEAVGKQMSETDLNTWKEYLSFQVLNDYAEYLSKDLVTAHFNFFKKTLRGVEEQQPRWQRAVDTTGQVLGEVLGKLYVAEHFKPEAKARMEALVANLIKAYEISIKELDWMTEETKAKALEKLHSFTPKIGYPDKWKDYSALAIRPDDLVGNILRFSHWYYKDMTSKLGQPVDRSIWHMPPQMVNAYYNPVMNEIVFPAAILQPPFFNMEADDAVNYGGIGAVIGHEIGHGFDDQGAKYDGAGNLKNWWSDVDKKAFEKRGNMLASQYDGFKPFDDAGVNGHFTLGENIGDLGGLTVAYKAYELSLDGKKSAEIDGFTGEQRVFLGWAQVWRRKYRDAELRRRLVADPHAPAEYRVQGVLSNMPEFYEAFDVKEGDAMYRKPEERIKIW